MNHHQKLKFQIKIKKIEIEYNNIKIKKIEILIKIMKYFLKIKEIIFS